MIILNKFDEFGKNMGFPSMQDFFEKSKYKNQEIIIDYLNNGLITMTQASYARDVFTGEVINKEKTFMNDGVYAWNSDLVYYVERYNLKLPDEFETHVLKQIKS